jgi:hypothetical protein
MTKAFAGFCFLILALFLGLNLPDLDQQVRFLVHRSLLTHGFLIPLIIFALAYRDKNTGARFFTMGFCLASVTHLCFDLFPKAWTGFALIHIPFWGRTSAGFSQIWIGLSIILCLYLAFSLIETLLDLLATLLSLTLAFAFYAASQPTFWLALITLMIAGGIALVLPETSRSLLRGMIVRRGK